MMPTNMYSRGWLALLSLLVVSFSACQEPIASDSAAKSPGKDLWTLMTATTNGIISITAHRHLNYTGAQYKAGGTVVANASSSIPEYGGTMVAGNVTIVPGANNVYDSDLQGGFGTTCTYSMSGNTSGSIPPFTTTMYVPAEIMMNGPLVPSLSRAGGARVTWNPDPSNANVIVFAYYEIGLSRDLDPTLPGTRITWHTTVPDNGSYTLGAGDLSAFPVGARVRLGVARGNTQTHTIFGQNFQLLGYSAADNFYAIVP